MENISIDSISNSLAEELSKYSAEITEKIKIICSDEAESLVQRLQQDSPKRDRKIKKRSLNRYSKGWIAEKDIDNNLGVSFTIRNKSDYQLTHLLENGFATRDGGRVSGRPHIQPNSDIAEKNLEEKINKLLGGD